MIRLDRLRRHHRSLASVADAFKNLVTGLSLSQFAALIMTDSNCTIQKWDPITCTISLAPTSWTVAYVLGQFHVKHIFPEGRLPDLRKLNRQISEWVQKRKWSIYMQKSREFEEKINGVDHQKSAWIRSIRSKLKTQTCKHDDILDKNILIYFSEVKTNLVIVPVGTSNGFEDMHVTKAFLSSTLR